MSLSSVLVQREVATFREVEEALARQVLYGGDLITNLFEVCKVDERALVPVVAEAFGIPPGPIGELPAATHDATRLVAAEVAMQRNMAPIAVDRFGLVVAVAEPLPEEVEQELTFALALPIAQHFAPLVRIRQALSRDYRVPLDKRTSRLLDKIAEGYDRIPTSRPPPRTGKPMMSPPKPPSHRPEPHARPTDPEIPKFKDTLVREKGDPPKAIKRRRGPLTIDVAKQELEDAVDRDAVFDVLFEFARQFFDYTAIFVVHGEIAEGRDAFGDGAPREVVARIGVPLDLVGILANARAGKKPHRAKPFQEGIDRMLMTDLSRKGTTECVVFPVMVRSRVVALILGDGGASGIELASVTDVAKIIAHSVAAFERIIMRRKLGSGIPPRLPHGIGMVSPGPPDVSERPSVEELAAPIRDLMNIDEPMPSAHLPETSRNPAARAMSSPDVKSDRPPPPINLLAVRRPSGKPIPREDPESREMPAVMPAAKPARRAPFSPQNAPTPMPRSRRRAEAPPLEFGATASASSFGETSYGIDSAEQRLIAEIHGREPPPPTMRDRSPPVPAAAEPDATAPIPLARPRSAPAAPATDVAAPQMDVFRAPMPPPLPAKPPTEPPKSGPPSERISAPPHKPPPSHEDLSRVLPTVIVDVATEYVTLVDRVFRGHDDDAEAELVRAGGAAMPAIMARFPGPIAIESERLEQPVLPRLAECGPVLRVVAAQRRTALPFVLAHVEDRDVHKRFWATYLLSELVYSESIDPAIKRAFDDEPQVRRAARAALRAIAEQHASVVVERLESIAKDDAISSERRAQAVEAIGDTRCPLAIPGLVALVSRSTEDVAAAARGALVLVTRQDFGSDAKKWQAWWQANQSRHRIEWLIDALTHDQAGIRAASSEELKSLTKEHFGYYDDLSKRERAQAQNRFREWWEQTGKSRFGRPPSRRG